MSLDAGSGFNLKAPFANWTPILKKQEILRKQKKQNKKIHNLKISCEFSKKFTNLPHSSSCNYFVVLFFFVLFSDVLYCLFVCCCVLCKEKNKKKQHYYCGFGPPHIKHSVAVFTLVYVHKVQFHCLCWTLSILLWGWNDSFVCVGEFIVAFCFFTHAKRKNEKMKKTALLCVVAYEAFCSCIFISICT